MKKLLIGLLAVLVLLVAGLGIFLFTFDLDRYKAPLASALEKALGNPVEIGKISLAWSNGIVFQVQRLAVYADKSGKPAATLEKANVYAKLGPLLQKRLEIVSVTLVKPRLIIVKDESGARVNGIQPPAKAPSAPAAPAGPGPDAFLRSISIGVIKIDKGEVGYIDASAQSALKKITLKDIDVLIKNISLTSPIDFEARFSLFSGSQNIAMKGQLKAASPQGPYTLQGFQFGGDLATINFAELSAAVPGVKNSGLVEPLAGGFKMDIERLQVDKSGVADLNASAALSKGRLQLESVQSPLENVAMQAIVTKNDFNLKKLSANFAAGTLEAQAFSQGYLTPSPRTRVAVKADKLKLDKVIPPPKPGRPQLQGSLSMFFNGDATGLSWPAISNTLNGNGRVALTEGVIVNQNLLKTIFDKMSKVPGVNDALNSHLPPVYREKLSQPFTVLEPLDFNVDVSNGQLIFPELRVTSTGFQIVGSGQAGLDGSVNFTATLFLDPQLSQMLLSTVPQLQYVANNQGLIAIPARVRGSVQNLNIEPEMEFIMQKVGQELLGKTLEKALKKTGDVSQGAAQEGGSAYESILGKLLQ